MSYQHSIAINNEKIEIQSQGRLQPGTRGGTKGVAGTTPFGQCPLDNAVLTTPF